MKILWNPLAIMETIGLFASKAGAGEVAQRWNRAERRDGELMADVMNLGGVLAMTTREGVPPDQVLAYDAGRRDFALQLLAMGKLSIYDLNQLLGDDDV
jgi:hypothetical protein